MTTLEKWFAKLGGILVTLGLLMLWNLVANERWIPPVYLPSPSATFDALAAGWMNGDLMALTTGTVERMLYGWLLASAVGIVLGAIIGVFPVLRVWLQPGLELLRPLPASALIPVAIAIFGLSSAMVLFVIAFGALWPVMLGTIHGFATVEPRLKEVAAVLRMSRTQFILKIGLPNAMSDALGGMRLALTISLILAVVGEMLAAQQGLGTAILYAARSFRAADLFAGVVLLGAIGLVSNSLLSQIEKRVLAWRHP